jgi:hypothetical protein
MLMALLITFVLAVAVIGFAGDLVLGGHVLAGAFGLITIIATVDYWRSRAETPRADRTAAYVATLALGCASRGLDLIGAWWQS